MIYIIDTNVRFDEEKAQRVLKEHGVNKNGYAHCAPYVVEQDGTIFLKTPFKSRVFQRRYENGELRI